MACLVVKVGTQAIVTDDGCLNTRLLGYLAQWLSNQVKGGHRVLLVSSGAVGLGKSVLHQPTTTVVAKQAAAAVGQPLLMAMYQTLFSAYQQPVAQVLVSGSDFAHRQRYLNIQATLDTLMAQGAIPIVNENDVVSAAALKENNTHHAFSDNDQLSAILAAKLNADTLIILTNVNGVYTADPSQDPAARRISRITHLQQMDGLNVTGQSSMGRGGMQSKLQAARLAAMSGVNTWIAPVSANLDEYRRPESLSQGTWIDALPQHQHLPERDQWIGYASGFNGVLVINPGARHALLNNGASLLAVGITGTHGQFLANQVVSLQDEDGNELGRGISQVSHQALQLWLVEGSLPRDVAVVHRNNMVLFEQY